MNGAAGWLLGFVVLVTAFVFGCSPSVLWDQVYQPDALSFKAAVMRIIPVGTTVAEAKSRIESKGFKCNMVFARHCQVNRIWLAGAAQARMVG
jgi:hypothetical protein